MRKQFKTLYYNDDTHIVPNVTIRIFRRVIKRSQRSVGAEVGVSREVVSNWENGTAQRNFLLERWYIEHGLLRFNKDFTELCKAVSDDGIYDKRTD